MSWPPKLGALLANAQDAYGVYEKLVGYSGLSPEHSSGGPKAAAFAGVLAIELKDLDYLSDALLERAADGPDLRGVRP